MRTFKSAMQCNALKKEYNLKEKNIYTILHKIELSALCLAPAELNVYMLMCVTALK